MNDRPNVDKYFVPLLIKRLVYVLNEFFKHFAIICVSTEIFRMNTAKHLHYVKKNMKHY